MKTIRVFLSENFQFLEVKFSIYFNRHVFVMLSGAMTKCSCMIWPAPVTYLKYTYFQNVNKDLNIIYM